MNILFLDFFLWLLSLASLVIYFAKKVNLFLLYGIVFLALLSLFRLGWIFFMITYRRKKEISFYIISMISLVMNGTNLSFLLFLFLLTLGFTGTH
ncbi:hypothetical protein ND861_02395 [Leptospira sp. 2 VSF19]|uniref:Uncharacterized protein n=1 Tax=Leptospira soteropolitanensis TaxID=2950025 RepID=A0AAW5VJI0_9LEPT|nr:hypothetical protein [Leptospira soteropolitanensis]MCW7491497.1 hypothetical protein [Leptospira soteropolitanensis]MCW7499081.1 hypothetical protein [Leptospira soteropolitanensis]MCW7521327.1 hypothetical protein [Leptospira soteropolitanensis]MCW7525185.1 hypothetical protein [Leptospira soteropolitanensis]MCW7529052.1 hypothetical protein [Leptospira soteropolitanensis]